MHKTIKNLLQSLSCTTISAAEIILTVNSRRKSSEMKKDSTVKAGESPSVAGFTGPKKQTNKPTKTSLLSSPSHSHWRHYQNCSMCCFCDRYLLKMCTPRTKLPIVQVFDRKKRACVFLGKIILGHC